MKAQIGKDIYFDLVDHDKVCNFRIQKQMPFTHFKVLYFLNHCFDYSNTLNYLFSDNNFRRLLFGGNLPCSIKAAKSAG